MYKRLLFSTLCLCIFHSHYAQEEFIFANYNGSPINLTAISSTVNDEITITFRDLDIVNEFFTQNLNNIYLYGGLDTDKGSFEGAPAFNDLDAQPSFPLTDGDSSVGPNTYQLTFNPTLLYSSVSNGSVVYGMNIIFQNELGGGGNNQTLELYIDFVDASKDSTLSDDEFNGQKDVTYSNQNLIIKNYLGEFSIAIYDILGRNLNNIKGVSNNSRYILPLQFKHDQIILIKFDSPEFSKTLKVVTR
ncbi:MAG: hypothetical protein R3213_07130 [Flavobacteriaceae bacterium]|nr:hypothetical protein [Flavobacteriaceae bacterium]